MKRVIASVAAVGLGIALAGCSAEAPPTDRPSPPAVTATVAPAGLPTPSTAPASPAEVTGEPTASAGRIAYGQPDGVWIANADGTGAHQLVSTVGEPLAWSADGTKMVKGVTLSKEELLALKELLNSMEL